MTATMISGRRIVRHSRRFFLQLCGWCHRSVGPAGTIAPRATCRCPSGAALLRVARQRIATLGLPGSDGTGGGPTPPPVRPRRASRRSAARLAA